jgi:SAM-dependent methyltransferase
MPREVHGLDISAEMVKQGEQRLAHLANVQLWHGNGYDLELFEDHRFDLVHCGFVLQHMPKTTAFNYLVETWRVLKPQGRFRFQDPTSCATGSSTPSGTSAGPTSCTTPTRCISTPRPRSCSWRSRPASPWSSSTATSWSWLARPAARRGPPEVTERLDFSLLEGDTMLGLATRHRQAVDRAWELEEALERIRRHPLLRAGRLLLGRPRRARGG